MTHVIQHENVRVVVIDGEPDDRCELCHKVSELRPYGPNGERICFTCGMENKVMTERRMGQVLFGEGFDA
jgi:hypothetical protein